MNPFDILDELENNWAATEAIALPPVFICDEDGLCYVNPALFEWDYDIVSEPDFGPEIDLWAFDEEIGE